MSPSCKGLIVSLARPLTKALDAAPDGAVRVVNEHRSQADGPGGWRNSNLRTRFTKMVRRAGLDFWPKPLHATRASFETELAEKYPVQVASVWLGNSPKVAWLTTFAFFPGISRRQSGRTKLPKKIWHRIRHTHRTFRLIRAHQEKSKASPFRGKTRLAGQCIYPRRMGEDSNPRRAFTLSGFQDRRLRPLGHPSVTPEARRTLVFRAMLAILLKISSYWPRGKGKRRRAPRPILRTAYLARRFSSAALRRE